MAPSRRARAAIGAVAAAALAIPLAVALRTFFVEYASFDGAPSRVDTDAARRKLPGLLEVSWQSEAAALRGWFVPGRERATVLLVHGSGGNRSELLPELEILAAAGFTLLAFDWPGHGESGGKITWDEPERAAVKSAVDWLVTRSEVDPGRIGALGFSVGGVPLIQEAADDDRVRAVAVQGTPASFRDFAMWEYRYRGAITQQPALLAMRMRGMHVLDQVPREVVGRIAPRPLFVVLGEKDTVVPAAMTRELFAAAGEPKELLALPGAGHGEYAEVGGATYREHLTAFFQRALSGDASAPGAP